MNCAGCGTENPDGAKFCSACGTPLPRHCPACHAEVAPIARFCHECGTALAAPAGPAPGPAAAPEPEALVERRHMSVMFCDLVGSVQMSRALDPEDLHDLIRAYRDACAEVVTRYEGTTAQFQGDGIVVYFGYPVAHEDDARRGVQAGLEIVRAIAALAPGVRARLGVDLSVRVAVHTGLTLVGDLGGAAGTEQRLALGDTPNIAARIQQLALPDTVVVSLATQRLVAGFFEMTSLGEHLVKGLAEPIEVFRVEAASGARHRLEAAQNQRLAPYVGRESAVAALAKSWLAARDSPGHAVLLLGEPGVGKSRLLSVFRESIGADRVRDHRVLLLAVLQQHGVLSDGRAASRAPRPRRRPRAGRAALASARGPGGAWMRRRHRAPAARAIVRHPARGRLPAARIASAHAEAEDRRRARLAADGARRQDADAARRRGPALGRRDHARAPRQRARAAAEEPAAAAAHVAAGLRTALARQRQPHRAPRQSAVAGRHRDDDSPRRRRQAAAAAGDVAAGREDRRQSALRRGDDADVPRFGDAARDRRRLRARRTAARLDGARVVAGPADGAARPDAARSQEGGAARRHDRARLDVRAAARNPPRRSAGALHRDRAARRRGLRLHHGRRLLDQARADPGCRVRVAAEANAPAVSRAHRAGAGARRDRKRLPRAHRAALDQGEPAGARAAVLAAGRAPGGGVVGDGRGREPSATRTRRDRGNPGIARSRPAGARPPVDAGRRADDTEGLGGARGRRRLRARAVDFRARRPQSAALLGAVGNVGVLSRQGRPEQGPRVRAADDAHRERRERRRARARGEFRDRD